MATAKQLIKELRQRHNVRIICKTVSNIIECYDFKWINGFLSVVNSRMYWDNNSEMVINNTSEIYGIIYAEGLIFRVLFSTDIVWHEVSVIR